MKRQMTAAAFVIGLMAYGSAAGQSPTPSVTASEESAGAPPLTAQQVDKMAKLAAQNGPHAPINKKVTDALGITSGEESLNLDQFATRENSNRAIRAFVRLPDDGYLLMLMLRTKEEWVFRLDKNFRLISAISAIVENRSERDLKTILENEARPILDSELKTWAGIADHIVPDPDSKKGAAK